MSATHFRNGGINIEVVGTDETCARATPFGTTTQGAGAGVWPCMVVVCSGGRRVSTDVLLGVWQLAPIGERIGLP